MDQSRDRLVKGIGETFTARAGRRPGPGLLNRTAENAIFGFPSLKGAPALPDLPKVSSHEAFDLWFAESALKFCKSARPSLFPPRALISWESHEGRNTLPNQIQKDLNMDTE
ncbi:uncharacterized protein PHA67_021176 [Liasis olivaceus]